MNKIKLFVFAILTNIGINGYAQSGNSQYVKIPETICYMKNGPKLDSVRIEPFEVCNHMITNSEYSLFIKASGYKAPYHWVNGTIPEGKEAHPVIFVNRFDVEAYLAWLNGSQKESYRLLTSNEFQLLAWAAKDKQGKWVIDQKQPVKNNDKLNIDLKGNRSFSEWQNYLHPSQSGEKNQWGLYSMLGNAWHLVNSFPDPAVSKYKFRVIEGASIERTIAGGSWARGQEYIRPGLILQQSPGICHPDIGFRLAKNLNRSQVFRRLEPVALSGNKILVSWAMLHTDNQVTGFNLYRLNGENRNHSGFRCNKEIIRTTSFEDLTRIVEGERYHYRVCAVDVSGKEINHSDWAGITYNADKLPVIAEFSPIHHGGSLTPVFGDLEGNGKPGCVIRLSNGNEEDSQDPGVPVQLEAFSAFGRSLWRKYIARHEYIYGSASNAAFNVWDMDSDGKSEVITFLQEGDTRSLAILDGMTGKVTHRVPWPEMVSDFDRSSTRIQLSIGYLDGKNPAVITQTGIYENEVIAAYDNELKPLWKFNSFGETNGSGGHKIEIADVDNDGKQEVVYGTTCLNADGSVRWSIYKQHPDIISIHDYIPSRKGLEIFYIIESTVHAGAYLVDANSGAIIWKNNKEDDPKWSHGHSGWTSDIWDGSPGLECLSNQAGHGDNNYKLFSASGKILRDSFPTQYRPIEYDGDPTRELYSNKGKTLSNFNGTSFISDSTLVLNSIPESSVIFPADLYGDFRDELVVQTKDKDGNVRISIVAAARTIIDRAFISPLDNLDYRLWLCRNKGGGYGSVHNHDYEKTGKLESK